MTIATLRRPKTSNFAAIILAFSAIHCAPEANDASSIPRDNFEARLGQGCKTSAECTQMYDEAEARYQKCVNAAPGRDPRKCEKEIDDRSKIRDRGRGFGAIEEKAAADDRNGRRAKEQTEKAEYDKLRKHADGSCVSLKRLDVALNNAETLSAQQVDWYRKDIARQRQEAFARAQREVERIASKEKDMDFSELASPEDALNDIPIVKASTVEMMCLRPDATTEFAKVADEWAAVRTKSVADEVACRKTPSCFGKRLAEPICERIANRRMYNEQIAQERRNPSGVVSLTTLHTLGRDIQQADEQIATAKADYRKQVGTAFSESSCK